MFSSTLFAVALALAVLISNVNGLNDYDIENIYKRLGLLHKKGFSHKPASEYLSLERDKNAGDDFLQLIQNTPRSPQEVLAYTENDFAVNERNRRNQYGRYRYGPWRQHLYVKPEWLKTIYAPKKRNYVSDDLNLNDDVNSDVDGYSKVYLVLDRETDITEGDVKDILKLVSSVLSNPNGRRKSTLKDHIQRMRSYKGFTLRGNRRRIRDSEEMIAPQDSVENDFKQKRARGDYGVAGGRTAIPYIGHRGDIYEKE